MIKNHDGIYICLKKTKPEIANIGVDWISNGNFRKKPITTNFFDFIIRRNFDFDFEKSDDSSPFSTGNRIRVNHNNISIGNERKKPNKKNKNLFNRKLFTVRSCFVYYSSFFSISFEIQKTHEHIKCVVTGTEFATDKL